MTFFFVNMTFQISHLWKCLLFLTARHTPFQKITKFPLTLITFRQKLVETCHMLHTSYKAYELNIIWNKTRQNERKNAAMCKVEFQAVLYAWHSLLCVATRWRENTDNFCSAPGIILPYFAKSLKYFRTSLYVIHKLLDSITKTFLNDLVSILYIYTVIVILCKVLIFWSNNFYQI